MSIFSNLFRKDKSVAENLPTAEMIVYPIGYHREGTNRIIVDPVYTSRWVELHQDKIVAVNRMLAFLKSQYPEVTDFLIRK